MAGGWNKRIFKEMFRPAGNEVHWEAASCSSPGAKSRVGKGEPGQEQNRTMKPTLQDIYLINKYILILTWYWQKNYTLFHFKHTVEPCKGQEWPWSFTMWPSNGSYCTWVPPQPASGPGEMVVSGDFFGLVCAHTPKRGFNTALWTDLLITCTNKSICSTESLRLPLLAGATSECSSEQKLRSSKACSGMYIHK